MIVLVLNAGSSSIKYQLYNIDKKEVMAKGVVDKIGMVDSSLVNKRTDGDEVKLEGEIVDHQAGIEYVLGVLISEKHGSVSSLDEIDAVGHRVVHGGESFHDSAMINERIIEKIEECVALAPLHNPPNLKGIYAIYHCQRQDRSIMLILVVSSITQVVAPDGGTYMIRPRFRALRPLAPATNFLVQCSENSCLGK